MSRLPASDFPNVTVEFCKQSSEEPGLVRVTSPASVEIIKDERKQSLDIVITMKDGRVMKVSTGGHNGYLDVMPVDFGESVEDFRETRNLKYQP